MPIDDTFPPYADLTVRANAVFDELIGHAAERRQGFGGLTHLINHAAALAELAKYGYQELAARGFAGHRQHLRLLRTLPNVADELGAQIPAEHDPRTSAFWQTVNLQGNNVQLDHRIKTLYGFDVLIEFVANKNKRIQANEKLRYLM